MKPLLKQLLHDLVTLIWKRVQLLPVLSLYRSDYLYISLIKLVLFLTTGEATEKNPEHFCIFIGLQY